MKINITKPAPILVILIIKNATNITMKTLKKSAIFFQSIQTVLCALVLPTGVVTF